jgi:hypothetical protein
MKANKASVVRLIELLGQVLDTPTQFLGDDDLRVAVKSQKSLAAYNNTERGIVSCSLNTLKKLASGVGEGFHGLESLRVDADKAFSKPRPKNKPGSRRTLQENKAKLERIVSSQDVDLQRLNLVISAMAKLCKELVELELLDRKAYYDLEIERIYNMLQKRRLKNE